MKKIFALLAALILVFVIAGCNSSPEHDVPADDPGTTETVYTGIEVSGGKRNIKLSEKTSYSADDITVTGTYEGGTSVLDSSKYTVNLEPLQNATAGKVTLTVTLNSDETISTTYDVYLVEGGTAYDVGDNVNVGDVLEVDGQQVVVFYTDYTTGITYNGTTYHALAVLQVPSGYNTDQYQYGGYDMENTGMTGQNIGDGLNNSNYAMSQANTSNLYKCFAGVGNNEYVETEGNTVWTQLKSFREKVVNNENESLWFVPSYNELQELYKLKSGEHTAKVTWPSTKYWCWSSSGRAGTNDQGYSYKNWVYVRSLAYDGGTTQFKTQTNNVMFCRALQ